MLCVCVCVCVCLCVCCVRVCVCNVYDWPQACALSLVFLCCMLEWGVCGDGGVGACGDAEEWGACGDGVEWVRVGMG